ncbi:MAG: diacylglycerol/lipid kinase family protein [Chitinophagales bacterium]
MKAYIMIEKWFVIINPVSGGKKAPKLWHKIKPLLDDAAITYETGITEYFDHAALLTYNAIIGGSRNILIIGGDGTAGEVVNGIFKTAIDPSEITIAMVHAGTGNDWVRTIGKYKRIIEIPSALINKKTFKHDVGIIQYTSEGQKKKRYFINIAGLGFEGYVVKRLRDNNNSGQFKGGKMRYWIAILRSLLFCKHSLVTLNVDGNVSQHKSLSIACGICNYNGSGLKQLPNAKFDDGQLDMTMIGDMSKFNMVKNLPRLTNGSHIKLKQVKTFRGKEIIIESDTPIYVEADGEFLGETPVKITVEQNALQVLKWR